VSFPTGVVVSIAERLRSPFPPTAEPALSGGRLCDASSTEMKVRRCCRRRAADWALDGGRTQGQGRKQAMDFAERAARNEEVFRDVNKRIEEGAEQHAVAGAIPFHCECGRLSCLETIDVTPGRYAAIVSERYHFLVIPGHEEPRIEQVVATEGDFLVVEKIGEAREQIERDHPQQHHHG
jgi:hypothetical protein